MAVPLSLKNAVIDFFDNDGTNTIEATLEDGDLNFTIPNPHEHILDRGDPGAIIEGTFEPISFSMTLNIADLTNATSSGTILDVVHGVTITGGWDYGVYVTGGPAAYSGKATALQDTSLNLWNFRVSYTNPATAAVERLFFTNCVATAAMAEGMPNKLTISGNSYETRANFMANIATA